MKKIVTLNLLISMLSKMIGFLSFIYIARELTELEYGNYVYILMVLSLLPLLQLGSMHGTVILLPKYIVSGNQSVSRLYLHSNIISHAIQLIAVILLFFNDFKLSTSAIVVIGLNFFLALYSQNAQCFLSAHQRFSESITLNVFELLVKPLSAILVFISFRTIDSLFAGQLIGTVISLVAAQRLVPLHVLKFELSGIKKSFHAIYKIGFYIYLIWAIDILFRTSDRWFISQFYSSKELAVYGFTSLLAINIWALSLSFAGPYVQILYTCVAQSKFEEARDVVKKTNKKIIVFIISLSLVSMSFYPFVLEYIVKKYFGSELLFLMLVISSLLLAANNMYIYYMICNNLHFRLLRYQIGVLLMNLILNTLFAFFHLEIFWFSISTNLSLSVYLILVRRCFYKDVNAKGLISEKKH